MRSIQAFVIAGVAVLLPAACAGGPGDSQEAAQLLEQESDDAAAERRETDGGPDLLDAGSAGPELDIEAALQSCPLLVGLSALPAETRIGGTLALRARLSAPGTAVRWSGSGGTFSSTTGSVTAFTCTEPGAHTLRASAAAPACDAELSTEVVCSPRAEE